LLTLVVHSYGQERAMNVKEIAQQEARIQKLIAEGTDEYTVKKQVEVLDECTQMVPQTQGKLEAAHDDLAAVLVGWLVGWLVGCLV
jgi:tubulin-specific chaperone A